MGSSVIDRKKKQLVDFLDKKVFNPILEKRPEDYDSPSQKQMLSDIQRATETTKRRYHHQYESAERVRDMFHSDLRTDPAQRIQTESEELGLPTFQDVRADFEDVCKRVGLSHWAG